jgi:hypothetical protein
VTYSNWRAIYWLQSAMSGVGLILSLLVIPTIRREVALDDEKEKGQSPTLSALDRFYPFRVLKLLGRPNILLAVSWLTTAVRLNSITDPP